MTEPKQKPTITIKCSRCKKDLVKDLSMYKGAKSRGQHDFYHRECLIGLKRDFVFTPKKITFGYGIYK